MPVDVLREAVRERVAATSLRSVETETGVSYTSLRWLLAGSQPYSDNLAKLTSWYFSAIAGGATAEALASILSSLPAGTRPEATEVIRAAIRKAYLNAGCSIPDWVDP
ncbi:MAG TPA: hypothetical protein VJU82_11440 [Acidobacteriaceae bacterium]|nr:hypothetical protein [Acidobacteriaceae bacterium]